MNILVISQTFWPDTVATSQAITDLVLALSRKGHAVRIITSRNNYEQPWVKYPVREDLEEIHIRRMRNTSFGKRSVVRRLMDFFSFNVFIFFRLVFLPSGRPDLIVSLTSPPLLPVIGVIASKLRRIPVVYWTMDLQPELSFAVGLIRKGSIMAKILQKMSDLVFSHATKIITLDHFMSEHIFDRIKRRENVTVIPIWPMTQQFYEGRKEENPFVEEHRLAGRFVVMYAGNHSLVHPVETLLDAAMALKEDDRFLFVHIGGGFRLKEVTDRKEHFQLNNIKILPFQPRERIHYSLGAADLQVVIMGEECVGFTHPNKIYGAMYLGKPVLYIGPPESHVTEILVNCPGNILVKHGESELLVMKLLEFISLPDADRQTIGLRNRKYALNHFDPETLVSRMVEAIESVP